MKLPKKDCRITDTYYDIGEYTKYHNAPKTDIILLDNGYPYEQNIRITVKYVDNIGYQLMSGGYNEAKAIILSLLEDGKCDELKDIFISNSMKELWRPMSVKDYELKKDSKAIKTIEKTFKKLNKIFDKLYVTEKDFIKAMILEACTGKIKFGETVNSAKYMVRCNPKNNVCLVDEISDELVDYLYEHAKIYVDWKTGTTTKWPVLRIAILEKI